MFNTYQDAKQYSVGDEAPVPLGMGQWRPGGYEQQGNQWVRPASAGVMGEPNKSALEQQFTKGKPTAPDLGASGAAPALAGGGSQSRWNPEAKSQMDAIGKQYGRQWRDDEYDQWLGPNGYINKDDIDGSGRTLKAYSGGDIDPYWKMRLGYHATGDAQGNGTTPDDANTRKGMNSNQMAAQAAGGQIDSALSGDPIARIIAALGKVNRGGTNLDALIAQLGG